MILTSICSHTLNMRSIVLSADDTVRIEILDGGEGEQVAVFDGGYGCGHVPGGCD